MEGRSLRRIAGLLKARMPEAGLELVSDPRRGRSKWSLDALLRAVLVGLMAGCGACASWRSWAGSCRRRCGAR